MSPRTLRAQDKRALRWGAIITIVALGYTFVIAPAWRALSARRAAAVLAEDALRREHALIDRTPQLVAQQQTTVAWLSGEARRLFPGHDDVGATSGLTDYLADAASSTGIQLKQAETRPAAQFSSGVRALHVVIRGEGDPRAVVTFLQRLEMGEKLVRLDHVTISHGAGVLAPSSPLAPAAPRAKVERLAVTADVYGYALLPASAPLANTVRVNDARQGAPYTPLAPGHSSDDDVDLESALAHNPLSPTRGVLPPPPQVAATPKAPPPFPVHLLGTATGRSGPSFAMCQVGDAPATVVHRGERVAGYTLRDITRGSIVLVGDDGHVVTLTLPTPGA